MEKDSIVRTFGLKVRYQSLVVVSVLGEHERYGRSWVAGRCGAVVVQLRQLLGRVGIGWILGRTTSCDDEIG